MILVGAILFFIPAPPTTLIGTGLIVVGAVLWLVDYFGGDRRGRRTEQVRIEERTEEPKIQ